MHFDSIFSLTVFYHHQIDCMQVTWCPLWWEHRWSKCFDTLPWRTLRMTLRETVTSFRFESTTRWFISFALMCILYTCCCNQYIHTFVSFLQSMFLGCIVRLFRSRFLRYTSHRADTITDVRDYERDEGSAREAGWFLFILSAVCFNLRHI